MELSWDLLWSEGAIATYTIIMQFVLGLLGIVAHYLKSKVRGQAVHDIEDYFMTHASDTLFSLIAFLVGFIALHESGQLTWLSAAMSGYMCDSFFSRVSNTAEKAIDEKIEEKVEEIAEKLSENDKAV